MSDIETWDWTVGKKTVPFDAWKANYAWVEEPAGSPDGEQVAAIVNLEPGVFSICVNGNQWEPTFDKAWNLRFSPNGRLTALVSDLGAWTVAVDSTLWPEQFDYVWDTQFSTDGSHIAVAMQQEMQYGMALDGVLWETTFASMTEPTLSTDGRHTAAVVQVNDYGMADIEKFQAGAFGLAVSAKAWEKTFVNLWSPTFSPDARHVAAQVRLNRHEYIIAVDDRIWEKNL